MHLQMLTTALLLTGVASSQEAGVSSTSRPWFWKKPETARWLTSQLTAGALSTTSVHLNGTAFGNPQSFGASDTGNLFFYTSSLDTSMEDVAVDSRASFTLSLQMLGDFCTTKLFLSDPEDPRCTRLTVTGKLRPITDAERSVANASVFSKHPQMENWPESHDFDFQTLDVEALWLIDMYGGASVITPEEYYAVKAVPEAELPEEQLGGFGLPPWSHNETMHTARWLGHVSTWGVLSTTSVRTEGTSLGVAFGNPNSFVDGSTSNSTGRLFFYVSDLDASMQDIAQDSRCSFTLSEEWIESKNGKKCSEQGIDTEDPTCTRLVFSGKMRNVTENSPWFQFAHDALFARHPTMKTWPSDHSWLVTELAIEDIWMINYFGGAQILDPQEYLAFELP